MLWLLVVLHAGNFQSLLKICTELNHTVHCLLSTDSCCTVHNVKLIQFAWLLIIGVILYTDYY